MWDLASGQPAQTLRGHSGDVNSVAWSLDGRLASGSYDGSVIVWDVAMGARAQRLRGHSGFVNSVAWSPDGQLASGSHDDTVSVWDVASGQPVQTLRGHSDAVTSVAWSADGRLASGSWDDTVIVWDVASGQPAQRLRSHSDNVTSVAWSLDGRLASGSYDGTVIVWDLASGQFVQTLRGHTDGVTSVAWSADGWLASGSYDGTVIVWDFESGQPAQVLQIHLGAVTSIAWSPDGRLISSSLDNTVVVYPYLTSECERVFSNLSEAEWRTYIGDWFLYTPTCPDKSSFTIHYPLLTVQGRWLLIGVIFGPMLLFCVGIGLIRSKTMVWRALRGAATGALLRFVGTLLSYFLFLGKGVEGIANVVVEFEGDAQLLIIVTVVSGAVGALTAALARPGKLGVRMVWGGGIGYGVLVGLIFGFLDQDVSVGVFTAVVTSLSAGLAAAIVSRVFTCEDDMWNGPKLRAGLKGAILGLLVGGIFVGVGMYDFNFYYGGFLWVLLAPIVWVINAVSTAIIRPGKGSAWVFWGVCLGCALLGGIGGWFFVGDVSIALIAADGAGTVGGLLAALATRAWWGRKTTSDEGNTR